MNTTDHTDPLAFLGANQSDLINAYLDPSMIKLDGRSTPEMFAFITKLSKQFWFYNSEDQKEGDWSDFFKTDLTSVLANISQEKRAEEYDRVLDFLNGIPHTYRQRNQAEFLWEIFSKIFDAVLDINQWYITMTQYHVDQPFQVYLYQIIWQKLNFNVQSLYAFYYQAILQEILVDKEKIDNMFKKLQTLHAIWNFNPFPAFDTPVPLEYRFKANTAGFIKSLQGYVKDFYQYYSSITKEANVDFDKCLTKGETEPHIGLLVSFLKVYKHQQNALNALLPRHLNFYYKDVLGFSENGASPDSAYLLFTLNKSLSSYTLPSATQLSAGVDATGNPLLYQTDQDLMVSSSVIDNYLTLFSEGDSIGDRIFYTSSVKSYAKPTVDPNTNVYEDFLMFGESDGANPVSKSTPEATLGFSIASPELWLEGGMRVLTITFTLTENASQQGDLTDLLAFSITGAKGWLSLTNVTNTVETKDDTLTITLTLDEAVEAVSGYNLKIHGAGYETTWPVLRAILVNKKNDDEIATLNPYNTFSSMSFSDFTIDSTVTNLSVLTIKTSTGTVSASSTATVFGNVPAVGSKFYIGVYEPFIKNTSSLCLSMNWMNLPDFATYYDAYNTYMTSHGIPDPNFAKESYLGSFEWLASGQWNPGAANQALFSTVDPGLTTVVYNTGFSNKVPYYGLVNPPVFSSNAKSGFISLTLTSPDVAFGNALYPQVVSEVTLANTMTAAKQFTISASVIKALTGVIGGLAKIVTGLLGVIKSLVGKLVGKKKKLTAAVSKVKPPVFLPVPNKPYLPQVKGVSVNYKSTVTVTPGANANHQFYRIHPFGMEQALTGDNSLIAQYPEWGYAFLGFEKLTINTTLTLLLGIKDNLDTTISEDFIEVKIEYLTASGWQSTKVLSDTTFGLAKTGIISFQIDTTPSNANPMMPIENFWIRISGDQSQVNQTELTMIATNAVSATRVISAANEWEQLENIADGTIKNFVQPLQSISKVTQPFASFGGEEPETTTSFRQRVAQRINHKERGLSVQNIQDMVLDKFKEIYQVNVVPGKNLEDTDNNVITLALVPFVSSTAQSDAYRPISQVSALSEVYNELIDKVSDDLTLNVEHAKFEELLITVNVTFSQADQTYDLVDQLNSDLKAFLSPWIEGNTLANTRDAIYVNDLIKFIGSRTDVASFDQLSLCQDGTLIYGVNDKCTPSDNENTEVIYPKDPRNIITSAAQHSITSAKVQQSIGKLSPQILETA